MSDEQERVDDEAEVVEIKSLRGLSDSEKAFDEFIKSRGDDGVNISPEEMARFLAEDDEIEIDEFAEDDDFEDEED